jgi:lipopolysaccharide assembly protein A
MIAPFLAGIFVAAVAILFAVQNSSKVFVTILWWSFQGSLALILCLTFLLGALAGFTGMLPALIRSGWRPFHFSKRAADLPKPMEIKKDPPK